MMILLRLGRKYLQNESINNNFKIEKKWTNAFRKIVDFNFFCKYAIKKKKKKKRKRGNGFYIWPKGGQRSNR